MRQKIPLAEIGQALRWKLLPAVFRRVHRENLTYLSQQKLVNLNDALRLVKRQKVPGDFVEFGVALGGSAIALASNLHGDRAFHGYDVFGMIPPPGQEDDDISRQRYEVIRSGQSKGIRGGLYYGYIDDLYELVTANFERYGLPVDGKRICLHKGLYADTLHLNAAQRLALVHIDCDWYEPVALCLARIRDHLSPGALVVIDDYNDYGGCRRATDDFVQEHPEFRLVKTSPHAILSRLR